MGCKHLKPAECRCRPPAMCKERFSKVEEGFKKEEYGELDQIRRNFNHMPRDWLWNRLSLCLPKVISFRGMVEARGEYDFVLNSLDPLY